MAGEAATIGTFSFFPSKNLGGYGDGGMIVTQDEAIFQRLTAAAKRGDIGPGGRTVEQIRVTLHESHVASASFEDLTDSVS